MRRRALALAGALLAGGCTLGPDYVRPPVDAPAAFRFAPKEQADTANLAWWTRFGDPVLDALIDEALANNRNVQVAVANVDQAAGVFTQVRSPLFPQLGYGASAARERASEAGRSPLVNDLVANPQNAYQAALSVTWELDLWGRIRRQSEAARAQIVASEEGRQGVILTLVSSVAGYRGLPKSLVYGPTKAALINLAETLYIDLKPKGLDVYVINPGFVKTPMTDKNDFDMPYIISPEEAAAEIISGFGKGQSLPAGAITAWVIPNLNAIASAYDIYCNCIKSGPAGGPGDFTLTSITRVGLWVE